MSALTRDPVPGFRSFVFIVAVICLIGCGGGSGGDDDSEPSLQGWIPQAPSDLTARPVTNARIDLEWRDNSSEEAGFDVERGTDGVNFFRIGGTVNNSVTYSDLNLLSGTVYHYRVRAFNEAGKSTYSNVAVAQTFVEPWARSYGGDNDDYASAVVYTADGGYLMAGTTDSFGVGGDDIWLVKTDAEGAVDWQFAYGGTDDDACHACFEANDGGFIVAGSTASFGAGATDYLLFNVDSTGVIEWQYSYGAAGADDPSAVIETNDGGFLVAGTSSSFSASDDCWLVKLDALGAIQWQSTYGGSGDDSASGAVQTWSGGFAVAGDTESFSISTDCWVFKIDQTGAFQWQNCYGLSGYDCAQSIALTETSDLIVTGMTDSYAPAGIWTLRLSGTGAIIWQKCYGDGSGGIPPAKCEAYAISPAAVGDGCLLAGSVTHGHGGQDFLAIKVDRNGLVEWEKLYDCGARDRALSAATAADSGFCLAGLRFDQGVDTDFWIVKTNTDGTITFDPGSGASTLNTSLTAADSNDVLQATAATCIKTTVTPTVTNLTVTTTQCTVEQQAP